MIFDPVYFLFVGPALALSLWASFRTKSAFKKFAKKLKALWRNESLRTLTKKPVNASSPSVFSSIVAHQSSVLQESQ